MGFLFLLVDLNPARRPASVDVSLREFPVVLEFFNRVEDISVLGWHSLFDQRGYQADHFQNMVGGPGFDSRSFQSGFRCRR